MGQLGRILGRYTPIRGGCISLKPILSLYPLFLSILYTINYRDTEIQGYGGVKDMARSMGQWLYEFFGLTPYRVSTPILLPILTFGPLLFISGVYPGPIPPCIGTQ